MYLLLGHISTYALKLLRNKDVTMKNAVFWDVMPCRSCVNRRFGGTYRLHLQGRKNPRARNKREQVAAIISLNSVFPR
jgi:hypothetical protein